TTPYGGGGPCAFAGSVGCGTVFQLTRPAVPGGGWTETVLYRFQGHSDGFVPGDLIADPGGNLYGVTSNDGSARCSCGTVFKLTRTAAPSGAWAETVLYRFQGIPAGAIFGDGANPIAITFGTGGALVGTTSGGGLFQGGEGGLAFGTIFELMPPSHVGGTWRESVLYRFTMNEQNPVSGVVIDKQGRLYGTTYTEVYQFASGTTRALHVFDGSDQSGGYYPYGGVILDASGNLYGTTLGGGQSTPHTH
ncbi:MAG: hypothetical protein H0X37_27650, partial [Herpetosiphonaceae bacterium]|nr:hypothetical protein [Herpetosiphonaceae bacterium]